MNKFTPGPWSTLSHSGCGKLVVRPKGQTHVQITPSEDAYLMAAAPDLLESLVVMTDLCLIKYGNLNDDVYNEIKKAQAAIAKARGNV